MLDHKIADLKKWDRAELIEEWELLWKYKIPKSISRQLLIRSIEYKYREQENGCLSESCRKELNRLVKLYRKNPGKSLRKSLRIKPGTKLLRIWGQETHEVLVLSDGYLHKGKTYQTLSQIAREITGTRWSGPLFFGLRKDKEKAA
ncbi:MAG: DUF2924 domain-containing protein [Alphaproteobacteria bacterium]|nr:MAG: DUF2924 domain-containing protein [Alphaproteobacteria bacterium]